MRSDETRACASCFPESLKSKKKYPIYADPVLEIVDLIFCMIAEMVDIGLHEFL
jgi:hypothetical protein